MFLNISYFFTMQRSTVLSEQQFFCIILSGQVCWPHYWLLFFTKKNLMQEPSFQEKMCTIYAYLNLVKTKYASCLNYNVVNTQLQIGDTAWHWDKKKVQIGPKCLKIWSSTQSADQHKKDGWDRPGLYTRNLQIVTSLGIIYSTFVKTKYCWRCHTRK